MNHLKQILTACIFLAFATGAAAQIKAVAQFVAENEGLEKFFIYQSSLRMLNQKGDEDFNNLIRDVRKINVYVSEQATDKTRESYGRLIKSLASDNFETLISVKQETLLVNFLGKESGRDAYYVLAMTEDDSFGVMEMDGKLDLRYLSAIENLDFDKLREIVGQDKNRQMENRDDD